MKILITGGLGFIGINAAKYFSTDNEIHIVDNVSRKGNMENYETISNNKNITLHVKDIRNFFDIEDVFKKIQPDVVLHLAGQVAVTFSVTNPREDFEINALGTFNILESIRLHSPNTTLLFASTNKVYGNYQSDLIEEEKRYSYVFDGGVNEETSLDFHSPYGCSKGSADQYVRDYSRIYGLKTVVLRQSCIYGQNQFGIEDQGWVAWFTIASTFGKKFFIYGDGKQVRDVLHIDDLINLYETIINNIDKCKGQIFNVGGGEDNTLSLLELLNTLGKQNTLNYQYSDWRPGDQKIYVSDITKLKNTIGWTPKIGVEEGLEKLQSWVSVNKDIFVKLNLI
jgi:CDP-paratose 2-epimerase